MAGPTGPVPPALYMSIYRLSSVALNNGNPSQSYGASPATWDLDYFQEYVEIIHVSDND